MVEKMIQDYNLTRWKVSMNLNGLVASDVDFDDDLVR